MPLMCAILSGLFIGGDNGWPPQANKQKSVSLSVVIDLTQGDHVCICFQRWLYSYSLCLMPNKIMLCYVMLCYIVFIHLNV